MIKILCVEEYDYNDVIFSFTYNQEKDVKIGDYIDENYKVVALNPIRVIEL